MLILSPGNAVESLISLNNALGGNIQTVNNLDQLIDFYNSKGGKRAEELTAQNALSERESDLNLNNNLVTIGGMENLISPEGVTDIYRKVKSSGLLLTTDGFVLTTYHNIREYLEEWDRITKEGMPNNLREWSLDMRKKYSISDQYGHVYPIDPTVKVIDPSHDIAIIKAFTGLKKPMPIYFNVMTQDLEIGDEIELAEMTQDLEIGDEVELAEIRNRELYNQYGLVIDSKRDVEYKYPANGNDLIPIEDTFLTDILAKKGDSGNIFKRRGEFAGLASYKLGEDPRETGYAGGAKINHILELGKVAVSEYEVELRALLRSLATR